MDLAVLGMGRMGQALAGRLLQAGHQVTIWNRSPAKAPELVAEGAIEAPSIAEAIEGADVVFTSLDNDEAVKAVALGEDGIQATLALGATYVDTSTVSPATSEALDEAIDRFIAMPVLGSPAQVRSGDATYLIGAKGHLGDLIAPLFPALSDKQRRYERPALAATAKLTVNLLLLDGVVALAEAFATGRAGNLSDDQLRELLGDNPMVAPGLKYRFEGILTGTQAALWTTRLGAKDARLATELAESDKVALPLTEVARARLEEAATRLGDVDIALVRELYRRP